MAEFIRRNLSKKRTPGEVVQVMSCPLIERYPAISEFLTLDFWDDKSSRETGTLLLCFGEGRWKAWLNDRDGYLTAWLSGETLTALLDAVEKGFLNGDIDWRAAPKQKRGKGGG